MRLLYLRKIHLATENQVCSLSQKITFTRDHLKRNNVIKKLELNFFFVFKRKPKHNEHSEGESPKITISALLKADSLMRIFKYTSKPYKLKYHPGAAFCHFIQQPLKI